MKISSDKRDNADLQVKEFEKQIKYFTADYPVEFYAKKMKEKDLIIPEYQRKYIWKQKNKCKFIESVLLGLPIPFMFFMQTESEQFEIIDGVQRISTITSFLKDELVLKNMEKLTKLNGFKFSDLSDSLKRKFQNKTIRVIILDSNTPPETRQDLFYRINTTGIKANDSEIRRGAITGELTNLIEQLSEDPLFVKLTPMSKDKADRHERFELVLRFFAFFEQYDNFKHSVGTFLDEFLRNKQNNFDRNKYTSIFKETMETADRIYEYGFAAVRKKEKLPVKQTPHVRFEALAVGLALALDRNPELKNMSIDVSWMYSEKFYDLTTSDASNNQHRLQDRIKFVRDSLLNSK